MSKVRIGFVGVGSMGQCAHLKNYVTLPDCEVTAIAELRSDLREKVAVRYGIRNAYENFTQMLDAQTFDGLVVAQPFNRHGVLVPEILKKAGVPIFTEKPLAGSVQCGERILQALAQSGTWHMVGYHKRSDPATQYAKAEIARWKQTGELGPMRYVRILMPAGDWVAGGFNELIRSSESLPPVEWDPAPPDMDAATYKKYIAFVNYYIHQVNLLRYLLGEPYRVTFADPSGVLLVAQSESGIAASIEMSPYQTTVDWHESALVAFAHGYIRLTLPAPLAANRAGRVEIFRDPGNGVTPETIAPSLPWSHAMREQAKNFVASIKGEAKPFCEAAEALEDLRIAKDYLRLQQACAQHAG